MMMQPGMAPAQPMVIQQAAPAGGKFPRQMACPHCTSNITTRVGKKTSIMQWLACCLIFWFFGGTGIGLLCCFVPFCIEDCYEFKHDCPNCSNQVA